MRSVKKNPVSNMFAFSNKYFFIKTLSLELYWQADNV